MNHSVHEPDAREVSELLSVVLSGICEHDESDAGLTTDERQEVKAALATLTLRAYQGEASITGTEQE